MVYFAVCWSAVIHCILFFRGIYFTVSHVPFKSVKVCCTSSRITCVPVNNVAVCCTSSQCIFRCGTACSVQQSRGMLSFFTSFVLCQSHPLRVIQQCRGLFSLEYITTCSVQHIRDMFKMTLFIRTKHNIRIFGVITFIKQQNGI